MIRNLNPLYLAMPLPFVLVLIGPYAPQAGVLTVALGIFLGTVGLQRPARKSAADGAKRAALAPAE